MTTNTLQILFFLFSYFTILKRIYFAEFLASNEGET